MERFVYLVFLFSILTAQLVSAQTPDSTTVDTARRIQTQPVNNNIQADSPTRRAPPRVRSVQVDSIQTPEEDSLKIPIPSSVSRRPFSDTVFVRNKPFIDELASIVYNRHPYFGFAAPVVRSNITSNRKEFHGKESLFYTIIGLLLFFAFLRNAFAKYLEDMYRLFFRTTMKQRQVREQLIQTPLPSLLLNIFFFIIGGYYVTILLRHFQLTPFDNLWLLLLYSILFLAAMYAVKFITLKFSGWVFNIPDAMDAYIFIVFLINKVISIFLLPFVVLLAFTEGDFYKIVLTISWVGVAGLWVYRFILTYSTVRKQVRVNPFHFLLYLLAFEVVPLLLIYKLLLLIF